MTIDPFTDAARAEAEDYARTPRMNVGTVRDRLAEAHLAGAAWGREQALAQERTADALTIDQHRVEKRWVGDGVRIECRCGHESSAVWDPATGLLTEESNSHRVADRLHAVHVADMLARAARRDEEKR